MFNKLKLEIKTLSMLLIVLENNDNNKLHLHGVVCIKNLIDYNTNIKNNISNFLRNNFEIDTLVKNLDQFLDKKNWIVNYLFKDLKNWEYPSTIFYLKKDQQKYANYLDLVSYRLNVKTNFICFENDDLFKNINGCKIVKNSIDKFIILDLILYYMEINHIYIYKDTAYKKIKNSNISFIKLGTISNYFYDNFKENVVSFFLENFKIHFTNFDFYYLIKNFINSAEININKIIDVTTNKIELNFSLLEFTDGIYSIKHNKFIPNSYLEEIKAEKNINVATIKYYKKTFKHTNKPKKWINDLKKVMLINDSEDEEKNENYTELCCYIANIFHRSSIYFSKKKVLYIRGESNTRKSTLIAKPLISYFGIENVGFINYSNNFKFQDLIDKKLGIFDEFKYDSKMVQEYLKLFSGEITISDQKYSHSHKKIEDLPIIIISNKQIDEKNEELKKAIDNRIFEIEFRKNLIEQDNVNISNLDEEIDKILKKEEASIIIYCNQIFFKKKYRNENRSKIKYEKIIKDVIKNKKENEIVKDFIQKIEIE